MLIQKLLPPIVQQMKVGVDNIRTNDPVLSEYARLAACYDSRWSRYVDATVRETLDRLNPRSGDKLLDVGCGTGALLHAVSSSYPQAKLAGVDLSPEMIEIARVKLGPTVVLECSQAERLPFPNETFDILVSTSVLHFLRRPHEVLCEARRVLKPGGKIVVTDWCHDYLACRLCDGFLRLFDRAHFRTYTGEDCKRLLIDSAFDSVGVDRYKISWIWGLMTAIGRKSA